MVEIHFKTFLPLAEVLSVEGTIAQSPLIEAVPLPVVRRGAAIQTVLLVPRLICHFFKQRVGFAGGWLLIPVARARAGALTPSRSRGVEALRVRHDHARHQHQGRRHR
jgi:hypothetical protein